MLSSCSCICVVNINFQFIIARITMFTICSPWTCPIREIRTQIKKNHVIVWPYSGYNFHVWSTTETFIKTYNYVVWILGFLFPTPFLFYRSFTAIKKISWRVWICLGYWIKMYCNPVKSWLKSFLSRYVIGWAVLQP